MDKSEKDIRPTADNQQIRQPRVPDEENPLLEKFDEADPVNDRTPAGDSGPEDAEKKKGPAPGSMTFY
jgi:hypothetical protein